MVTLEGQSAKYYCELTDDKPESVPVNTIITELDTGDQYYFTGETWAKIGGGASA